MTLNAGTINEITLDIILEMLTERYEVPAVVILHALDAGDDVITRNFRGLATIGAFGAVALHKIQEGSR